MSDEAKETKNEPGKKFDFGKPPVGLVSSEAIIQIAKVLEFGAKKYSAHNWRGGISWSRVADAALRHLLAWKDGEDNDPETGLSHLAHLGCCVTFLLEYLKTHPELDDRYKPMPFIGMEMHFCREHENYYYHSCEKCWPVK